jgi:hypothetical protein
MASENMNAGNLDPENDSETSENGPGKSGFRWILIIVAIALALYAAWHLFALRSGSSNEPSRATAEIEKAHIRSPSEYPTPVYGTITIYTNKLSGLEVKKGWNLRAVPVGPKKLDYEYYVDGVLQSDTIFTETRKYWAEWRLKPGQGIEQVELAYVLYVGPEPELLKWYNLALAAGDSTP